MIEKFLLNSLAWLTLIDECIAHEDKTISFKFKNGYEITK